MKTIYHQLRNEAFYKPDWDVEHLFLGTFNPWGGEPVNYFYGRNKNQTWKILSKIFGKELKPERKEMFFKSIGLCRIACMDMIDSVYAEENRINKIVGEGYKDSEIINKKVKRVYNTKLILDVIQNNPGVKVYSTWGKGANLNEWESEVKKIGNLIPLVSPSLAARVPKGETKYEYMLRDWSEKILV